MGVCTRTCAHVAPHGSEVRNWFCGRRIVTTTDFCSVKQRETRVNITNLVGFDTSCPLKPAMDPKAATTLKVCHWGVSFLNNRCQV